MRIVTAALLLGSILAPTVPAYAAPPALLAADAPDKEMLCYLNFAVQSGAAANAGDAQKGLGLNVLSMFFRGIVAERYRNEAQYKSVRVAAIAALKDYPFPDLLDAECKAIIRVALNADR